MNLQSSTRSTLHPWIFSSITRYRSGGIPGSRYLLGSWLVKDGLQDSIGLSVSDYGLIGSTWQTVFFTNPTTPITHTRTEWVAILLAHPSVNLLNVLCSATGDVLIYRDDTSREILNKALRYLKLPIIVPPIIGTGFPYTLPIQWS